LRVPQMPNQTHLKRLISDAVFEAQNILRGHSGGDRFYITREDSRIIAGVVFDALSRAKVLIIDQPSQPNPWSMGLRRRGLRRVPTSTGTRRMRLISVIYCPHSVRILGRDCMS
jgi:hypothetical protein